MISFPPSTPAELKSIVALKARECQGCGAKYRCTNCYSLYKHMCRDYHLSESIEWMSPELAQRELAGRLAFEVIFGFVPAESVEAGAWLDGRLRDRGHTERMWRLWFKASQRQLRYGWLKAPAPAPAAACNNDS